MLCSALINQVQIYSQSSTGFKSKLDMLELVTRRHFKQNPGESKQTKQVIQEQRGGIQFIPHRQIGFPQFQ